MAGSNGCHGSYVYGIAAGDCAAELGQIGIENSKVYTIPYRDICAVVHDCTDEPYRSENKEVVEGWVKAHQRVIDVTRGRFGAVIPMRFDVIVRSQNNVTLASQVVESWLRAEYETLKAVMGKISGRDEYAVQISYELKSVARQVAGAEDVKTLSTLIATKPPGMAYLYRQKLERLINSAIDRLADRWYRDFYHRVARRCDGIVVEKNRKLGEDRVMLLNLSCLVHPGKVQLVGEELDQISRIEGIFVHFSGPWAPYSFTDNLETKLGGRDAARDEDNTGRPAGQSTG